MKKTLCLILSLVMMASMLVFTQAPTVAAAGQGHTPYMLLGDLMINNADSLTGWDSTSMFNTTLSAGTEIAEGSGSVTITATIPKGQSANIGAMTMLTFPSTDLSSYEKIQYKVYFSHALSGTHQFQANFITGSGGDGYNSVVTFGDYAAGWHTFTIDRASVPMAATADWKSINAIRFTWFNHAQVSTNISFTFDEIKALWTKGHTPYAVGNNLMINNADSLNGWSSKDRFNTNLTTGAQVSEGSGSVTMTATIPKGQSANIGAMTVLSFPAVDLSSYDKIQYKLYLSHALTGSHQIQTNFITGTKDDGYNHVATLNDSSAGWHTITIDRASVSMALTADWASINAIRFTWFNYAQITTEVGFTFDEIMAVKDGHTCTAGSTVYSDANYHWNTCTGCDEVMNKAAHSGGEATCIAKAVCSTCSQSYGSLNANNHKHTEVRNQTATYTGDTYCTDCNTKIASGETIVVTPTSNVIVSFDDGEGFTATSNTIAGLESSNKTEGVGSFNWQFSKPIGQAGGLGGLLYYNFPASVNLSSYDTFKLDVYVPVELGGGMLQVNFCTDGVNGQDGFNFETDLTNFVVGWNTITMTRTNPTATNAGNDWSNINRIRILWSNTVQVSVSNFLLDNLCGVIGSEDHECTAGTTIQKDANYHWNTCTGCGEVMNKAAHSGGTATCTAKAVCSVCSTSYGSVNASNHTGGTEVKNAKAATCGAAGYTGDTYCKGCGVKTATGSTIAATGNHTGGEATCIAKAVCSTCSQSYGSLNANNHKHTEVRNQTATYTGDTYCTDCNTLVAKGSTVAPDATATVATVKAAFKAGEEVAIPVTITEWSNAYAYITVSMPTYDTSLLKFDGFDISSTDFKGALGDYGNNGFALIASPSSENAAAKLKSGEVCIIYFIALVDITESTEISVVVKANGYTKGSADNWIESKALTVTSVSGGIEVPEVDVTGPSVAIGNVTNNVANNQTITVNMNDASGIAGYYFGTSATYTNNAYVATTATSFTKNITAAGTYYITVVDALGNPSETIAITFYMVTLNANGGSATLQNILVKNGNTVALPTATRDGYTYVGWGTGATATSGVTSVTVNANATYYAVWKDATKPIGSVSASNNALANTQTVTITMSDNEAIAGYYFGTSATYTDNTYVATTATTATETITAAGTYYLTVVDKEGNVSSTVSITFYMITLNANGGSASVQNILAVSGATVEFPDATKETAVFNGWATTSTATEGVTSIVVSGNATYYAAWKAFDYGNFDGEDGIDEIDALNVLLAATGKVQLTEEQEKLCDVDGNGVVDNVDALYILQYAVGRITSFPVQK